MQQLTLPGLSDTTSGGSEEEEVTMEPTTTNKETPESLKAQRRDRVVALVSSAVDVLGRLALKERRGCRLGQSERLEMYDKLFAILEELNNEDTEPQGGG